MSPARHRWDLTPADARALQATLADEVDTTTPLGDWDLLAAADVSFGRYDRELAAAVVVVRRGTFEVVERVGLTRPIAFPYIPGLLSFREAPALIEAFGLLSTRVDVVLCDGQGVAHPRGLGIASHLGLWLDRPTIGCAKSRLFGLHDDPGPDRGDRAPLRRQGRDRRRRGRPDEGPGQAPLRLGRAPMRPRIGRPHRPGDLGTAPPADPGATGPRVCQRGPPGGGGDGLTFRVARAGRIG